jgi:hypothetical protein
VIAAVGCLAIRHDRQVQGDATTGSSTRPRPTAVGHARRFDAGKPTLDDFPDIRPFLVNESNANVTLERGSDVMRTARISGETVGQRNWVLGFIHGQSLLD